MHLLTVTEHLRHGSLSLAPGSYLADNVNAGELLAKAPHTLRAERWFNPAPIQNFTFSTGSVPTRILIIRTGGFGDLLFLTPALRALRKLNPEIYIAVACFDYFAPILRENPDIDEFVSYPVPSKVLGEFDAIVPLENTVESDRTTHAVDRYLSECGIDPATIPEADKRCLYDLTEPERIGALSAFPIRLHPTTGDAIPRLGVQAAASALCRTYPHDRLAAVCQHLHQHRGWEIFFFGEPGSLNIREQDGVTNLTLRKLDIRQSAAVLATCDVVLAPDSALAHIAGALDLPCVALYGPFPWQLRTAYHPKTFALSGQGECSPCFHQVLSRTHFPPSGPCAKTGRCEVLAAIPPERIAAKICALHKASLAIASANHAP